MAAGDSGRDPCVIVVGDPCSEFVRATVRLAQQYEVEAVQCEDVYAAVAASAQASGRQTLVIGALRDLAREDHRFFRIAEANALRCCCLIEKDLGAASRGILAALRTGAAFVENRNQIDAVFSEWLAHGAGRAARVSLRDLMDEDLRATEAELSALLGQGTDV